MPVGVGSSGDEARLVESDRQDGGVPGGEMYRNCGNGRSREVKGGSRQRRTRAENIPEE